MFWEAIEKRETTTNINDWGEVYSFKNGYDNAITGSGLQESTYFSCLRIISEGVAKCPIVLKQETELGEKNVKDHYLHDLLRLRFNPYMSAADAMKTFVTLVKHKGIAGLYIDRSGSKIKGLYPVEITNITIDNAGLISGDKNNKILYDFTSANNEIDSCFDRDMIIIRDFTLDGINYKATKSILRESLDTSIKSQNYLNTLFSDGLTNKVVVQLTSDITDEKELTKIQKKFGRVFSNNRRIFTVPAGYQISALNLSLADAQFSELRHMSKKDMASAMGVPLSKLGEMKENAKSEEQDNLSFLIDTLQIIFTQIEQEMDYKLLTSKERELGYKIRFNTNVLLRMDAKTQAEVITTYVKNGVYDLDYAKDLMGVERIGGDKIITLPSGQVTLNQLLRGEVSYIKDGDESDTWRS